MSADLREAPPEDRLAWDEALAQYLPSRYRSYGERYAKHLPLALIVTLLFAIVAGLNPYTAFIDEALYINVGYDYFAHWFSDGPFLDRAAIISGVPYLWPVIAAGLDMLGGLTLVRLFNFLLMAAVIVLVGRTTVRLFDFRAGMFAAGALAFVAPTAFLAQLATHDALSLALLAGGLHLGVTRTSKFSAVMVGGLFVAACLVKYTALAFVPVVLGTMLFAGTQATTRRGLIRTSIASGTTLVLGASAYLLASDSIIEGLYTTTLNRTGGSFGVIAPATTGELAVFLVGHIGVLIGVALLGVARVARDARQTALTLVLVGGATILPGAQMLSGELSSFEKHLTYSAIFLAPLAGVALAWASRQRFAAWPPVAILVLMLFVAEARASTMVYWGDVRPIIDVLEDEPMPGTYLSSNATVLRYHTRSLDYDITWIETFDFWDPEDGRDLFLNIPNAVETGRFERVIVRGDDTGNPAQNVAQERLLDALYFGDNYDDQNLDNGWRVFTRIGEPETGDVPQLRDTP